MSTENTLRLWIPFDEEGNILWEDLVKSTESINKGWGVSETERRFPITCQPGSSVQSLKSVGVMCVGRTPDEPQGKLLTAARGKQVCVTYMQDGVEKTVCYPPRPRC